MSDVGDVGPAGRDPEWEWTQFYVRSIPISVNIAHTAARNIRSLHTATERSGDDEHIDNGGSR